MVDPSRVSCEPASRPSGQALESHQYRIAQPLEKNGTPGGIREHNAAKPHSCDEGPAKLALNPRPRRFAPTVCSLFGRRSPQVQSLAEAQEKSTACDLPTTWSRIELHRASPGAAKTEKYGETRILPARIPARLIARPDRSSRNRADTAAQLVDRVLPEVPIRQWVLTLPYPLRYRCAYDSKLTSDVLRAFTRSLFAELRRRARNRWGERAGASERPSHPRLSESPRTGAAHEEGAPSPQRAARTGRRLVLRSVSRWGLAVAQKIAPGCPEGAHAPPARRVGGRGNCSGAPAARAP